MIETRKREHSRKPDEQYPFIEACSPGPFLEMFSRHARKGWTLWGDESDEELEPRGKTHRGYGGGAIEAPAVARYERLDGEVAEALGAQLRAFYESGLSIRDLQKTTGYSIQRVRGLLERAGADLRPRGGAH